MYKTFRIFFSLKNTYRVNTILYSLKQIPLVRNLLPQELYGVRELKIFANVIAAFWELVRAFGGKALYLITMILLPALIFKGIYGMEAFLHILFFLTWIGAVMNTYLLEPRKDVYYAVFLLRMDAKGYALVNYGYEQIKLLIGFFIFGVVLGFIADIPFIVCLMIPFFVSGSKATVAAFYLRKYDRTGRAENESLFGVKGCVLAVVLLAAAYAPPAFGLAIPIPVLAALMAAVIAAGAFSVRKILFFSGYREVYRQLLNEWNIQIEKFESAETDRSRDAIALDLSGGSKKKGFEYLNELFIKRHRKILWKSAERISVGCFVVLAVLITGSAIYPEMGEQINELLMNSLPLTVFLMYVINRGVGFTQALFMNCDHSLLRYSFYRKPGAILRLFRIRLRELTKINLVPAGIIGIGLTLLLYVTGGTDDVLNYFVLLVSIPAMSMFFSVHYLALYYLLQPYNAGTEIKSGTYKVIMGLTYIVAYMLVQVQMSTLTFGIMTIVFCAVYCIVACVLAYRIAPKTFKIRP